jgi:hypothetical protein
MKRSAILLSLCLLAFGPVGCQERLVLKKLIPAKTQVGTGFNVQPGGASALAITAKGATAGTIVLMDGQVLSTSFGGPEQLSAIIPAEMYAKPGRRKVELLDGDRKSNAIMFNVMP